MAQSIRKEIVCSDVRGCSFQPFPTLETQAQETWRTCVTSTVEKNNRLGQPPLRPITPQMLFPLTPFYDPLAHEAQQQAAYSRSRTNPALQLLQEFQIGLYDLAEADLEHFRNTVTWSAGFLRERLYSSVFPPRPAQGSGRQQPA